MSSDTDDMSSDTDDMSSDVDDMSSDTSDTFFSAMCFISIHDCAKETKETRHQASTSNLLLSLSDHLTKVGVKRSSRTYGKSLKKNQLKQKSGVTGTL